MPSLELTNSQIVSLKRFIENPKDRNVRSVEDDMKTIYRKVLAAWFESDPRAATAVVIDKLANAVNLEPTE